MLHLIPQNIEKLLIDGLLITQEQLQLFKDNNEGLTFFNYVVDKLKIDQEQIMHLFSKAFNLKEIISFDEDNNIDIDLLGQINIKFLRDNIIVLCRQNSKVIIVIADPSNYTIFDELKLVIPEYTFAISTKQIIIDTINKYYPLEGTKKVIEELEAEEDLGQKIDFNVINEEDISGMAQEAPIIKLVNNILYQAFKKGASDIHIEPFEKELRVRYRVDGSLYSVMTPPKRIQSALTSRIKIMSHLNIAEKRQPQDGRIQIGITGKPVDIRVSVLPVVHGENIVMRLLDKTRSFIALEDLQMSERDLLIVKDGITQPNGIILVTGPTGSGKTSTLYAILNRLNQIDSCIITVEDPVEYQMMGVCQVQVREKIGLTFAAAIRSILRQDPDIVMIGETRDQETAQISIQAALTGHLVLSTLHTNSACASITRLIDMGLEPFLITSALTVVIAQRLVRRLCEKCKEQYTPTTEDLRRLPNAGAALMNLTEPIYRSKGCSQCFNSGYKGRLPIFEVLKISPKIVELTSMRSDSAKIEEAARQEGMTSLIDDGILKIKQGITTIDEVLTVAMSH
jgi:general secretion pathway protein E